MKYTSIFEKILCLFQLLKSSWANLFFLGIIFFLLILMFKKKISKKICFIWIVFGYLILLVFTCMNQYDQLSTVADSFANHFFTGLYFPSVYVYSFVFVFLNLVAIFGLLKTNGDKVYKMIHGICFVSMNFMFTLVLNLIADNKIDVFSKKSLFSNTNLVVLLELSVNIFVLWIIGLLITYLTNQITARIVIAREDTVLRKKPAVMDFVTAMVDNSKLEEEYLASNYQNGTTTSAVNTNLNIPTDSKLDVQTHQFIPDFIQNKLNENTKVLSNQQLAFEQAFQQTNGFTADFNKNSNVANSMTSKFSSSYSTNQSNTLEDSFDLSSFIPKKQTNTIDTSEHSNLIFQQILNNKMPLVHENKNTNFLEEEEKNTYTLNDYRIFNKMLKDIKEHNQSNVIRIDKNLEYRLITKYSNETYLMFKRMLKNYSN